jgi:hypothetical protein
MLRDEEEGPLKHKAKEMNLDEEDAIDRLHDILGSKWSNTTGMAKWELPLESGQAVTSVRRLALIADGIRFILHVSKATD